MSKTNVWISRFQPEMLDEELQERTRLRPAPLMDLSKDTTFVAVERLKAAQKEHFVPTKQVCKALRALVSAAYIHALQRYEIPLAFIQDVYLETIPERWTAPICLTGLAGVGKSCLLRAIQRVFPPASEVELEGHGKLPLVASWMMTAEAGVSTNSLLLPHLRDSPSRSKNVQAVARRELLLCGVSLLGVDELQFITQSDANVKAAKTLMQLSCLGPPLAFCANYSLLHRLLLRPHEERQRLFSRCIVLSPDCPESEDWEILLQAMLDIAPEFSRIDVKRSGKEIHRYTAGLPRLVAHLLAVAYQHARERNVEFVAMMDVQRAYTSAEYAIDREDVETLSAQAIATKPVKDRRNVVRHDLWCPLGERHESNVVPADQAIAEYERRVVEGMVESSLNANERESWRAIKAEADPPLPKSGKVVRMPRPPVTSAALLEGADLFAEKPNKPGRR